MTLASDRGQARPNHDHTPVIASPACGDESVGFDTHNLAQRFWQCDTAMLRNPPWPNR